MRKHRNKSNCDNCKLRWSQQRSSRHPSTRFDSNLPGSNETVSLRGQSVRAFFAAPPLVLECSSEDMTLFVVVDDVVVTSLVTRDRAAFRDCDNGLNVSARVCFAFDLSPSAIFHALPRHFRPTPSSPSPLIFLMLVPPHIAHGSHDEGSCLQLRVLGFFRKQEYEALASFSARFLSSMYPCCAPVRDYATPLS